MIRWFVVLVWLVSAWGEVLGVERFPPPEFDSGYKMPATTVPSPRAPWLEYLDVAVLLATLSLASYFVLRKRSRRPVFGLMLFSLAYFGFYRQGCICAIGSIQDVTLALSHPRYAVPFTVVVFFFLPLLFTVIFGRTFCAAVCPLGAIQDVVLVRPLKVRPWLEHALGWVPYLYLGAAVLFAATASAFIICDYDPFVAFFRRSGSWGMLGLGTALLVIGMFVGRPYCRFLCPYGAVLSLVSRISKWNVTLSPADCIQCQLCDVACPFGAIDEPVPAGPNGGPRLHAGRLAGSVVLLVALVGAGSWLGGRLSVPLSKVNPTVRLAERIAAEDAGQVLEAPGLNPAAAGNGLPALDRREETLRNASLAFRQTGRPAADLFAEANTVRGQFAWGGCILGIFAGFVIGFKLISLSFRQPRTVYEPNRAACVACGRCYTYCPKELVRLKRIQGKKTIPLTPMSRPQS